MSEPERRETPAGTPILSFRLRVDADPETPTLREFVMRVVCLGTVPGDGGVAVGCRAEVVGSLAERRQRRPGGGFETRYEVLARTIRVR